MNGQPLPSPVESNEHFCPVHGGRMMHNGEGFFWCRVPKCLEGFIDPLGLRRLHEELCRLGGMDAGQIAASWNVENPGDPW